MTNRPALPPATRAIRAIPAAPRLARSLALIAALLLGAPVPAQLSTAPLECGAGGGGATDCGGAGPASPGNTSGTDLGAGNPINVASGNKYQRETDLPALPGVLGLEIVRHYNGAQRGLGQIGRGWRLSYETDLYAIGPTVQIVTADGQRLIFQRDPDDPALCASANPADGRVVIERAASGQPRYRWIWPNGRVLDFDGDGRLVQIQAPSGEFVSLMRGPRGELLRVTDPQGRSLTLHYARPGAAGFQGIVAIDSPVGRFEYAHAVDGPGVSNLLRVVRPDGRNRHYHYEPERQSGHPHALTGISQSLTEAGALQRLATWAYDTEGRAVLSVRGEPRQLDEAGRPVPGTGIEQVELDFVSASLPDGVPGETVLTNSLGQITRYRHAQIGGQYRLLEARGPGCAGCGETDVRYGYDRHGAMTETTRLDPAGRALYRLHWTRDELGRVTRLERQDWAAGTPGPLLLVERREYALGHPGPSLVERPSVVPGREHQLRITYNERGQPIEVTETGFSPLDEHGEPTVTSEAAAPIERTTTYRYTRINGRSLLAEIDGPLPNGPANDPYDSDITRIQWDVSGNYPVLRTEPGGRQTRLARNPAGRVRTRIVTDGVRQISRTVHLDTRGAVLQQRVTATAANMAPLAREYAFTYDALGRLASARGADGITTTIEHAPDGTITTLAPDGRLVELHDSERRLLARAAYDAHDELAWAQMNLWDEQNRLVARLDADGILQAYGLVSQPEEVRVGFALDGAAVLRGTDAAGLHQLSADGGMRSLSMRDGAWMLRDASGRGHVLLKDDFGRTVIELAPDEGRLLYAYRGATVEKRQLGLQGEQSVETLRFDPAGRLIERRRAGCTETLHYQGDLLERLQGCASAHVFVRDAFGQITVHEQHVEAGTGALRFISRYAYAPADGRLVARSLPDGQRLHYHYDPRTAQPLLLARERGWLNALRKHSDRLADRLHASLPGAITEEALISDITPAAPGQAPSYRHANGLTTRLIAGRGGRIQSVSVEADDSRRTALLELRYTHDRAGRITATELGGSTTTFSYDAAGRLAETRQASHDAALLRTAYTPMGERRSQQGVLRDGFGRQIAHGASHLVYDDAHRLTEVHRNEQLIARYTYDALGNRISKTVDGRTTFFVYDLQHRLIAEADDNGHLRTQYLYAGHRPHTLLRAHGTARQTRAHYAIHADPRGLALTITDERANVVWQQPFGPFGEALPGEPANDPDFHYPLRLAGQFFDPETGLHYNIHRYYDPHAGRYLTPDPLGLTDSDNRYAYVGNDPLGAVDPLGLFPIDEDFFWTSWQSRPLKLTDQGGHLDILMTAFTQYQMDHGYRFSQTIIDQIVRNNYHTDSQGSLINLGGGQGNIYNHWDNPNNGPMCQDMFCNELMPYYTTTDWMTPALAQINRLRGNYASVGGTVSAMTIYNIRTILSSFGQNTHAIADFYAHTNWVDGHDRGGAVCNDFGTVGFVGTPPVRPDRHYVPQDPSDPYSHNYRVFEVGYVPTGLNQHTLWDETIVEGLFSGTVKLTAEPVGCPPMQHGKPGDIECRIDPTTHGYWHKDDSQGPGGSAAYTGPTMFGWVVREYNGEPPKRNGVPLTFGTEWYADLGVTESDLKIGDRIYEQIEIKDTYQLAFHLAVEHTKKEIERLYDAAEGVIVGGMPLREVYKMDARELSNARIGYLGMDSKERRSDQ